MEMANLPKIAVIYAPGATSILTIKAASLNLCRLVILYGQDCTEKDIEQINLIKSYVCVYDISGKDVTEVFKLLKNEDVQGILTFSEYKLRITSILCEMLGLIGNSYDVVLALTDKLIQRQMLDRAGVESIKYAIINKTNYLSVASEVGYPSIIKPREGAGSKWTQKVNSEQELSCLFTTFPDDIEYIFEEYLEGAQEFQNVYYGDYVSVESLHRNGESKQVCITAKTPLTDKYAETGMFIPNPFSEELNEQILELERNAIAALGVREGITHTEIKLTSSGPKIIEVNGRLGGYVSEIIKRGMSIDLVKLAFRLAVGESLVSINAEMEPVDAVYYQLFIQANLSQDATLKGLEGVEIISEHDDVSYVELRKNPGDFLSHRYGTENNIGVVYGESSSFSKFENVINAVKNTIKIEYEYGDYEYE